MATNGLSSEARRETGQRWLPMRMSMDRRIYLLLTSQTSTVVRTNPNLARQTREQRDLLSLEKYRPLFLCLLRQHLCSMTKVRHQMTNNLLHPHPVNHFRDAHQAKQPDKPISSDSRKIRHIFRQWYISGDMMIDCWTRIFAA